MGGITIRLTATEILSGALVGVLRQVQNLERRRKQANNHDPGRDWQDHIEGALGEKAVAKWLDRYWSGRLGKLRAADVGPYEVRTSANGGARLILHPRDPDGRAFVLVTGCNGEYTIRGWLYAREGKRLEFWGGPRGRAAFFVPVSELSDPASLPQITKRGG